MSVSDGLSWVKRRLRFKKRSRSRRGSPLGDIRDWLLEDRCLLSGVVPVPVNSNTPLNQIFWNGGASLNPNGVPGINAAPTVKTITITNTTDQTIYPILRDANTGQNPANTNPNNPGNYYDPQDNHNEEFRAYIGYVGTDGKQYLGLPGGATIAIRVPLVFWDAENMYIATDGNDLTPTDPVNQSNPFRYDPSSARGVSLSTDSNSWVTSFTASNQVVSAGLVMFYHATAPQTPALDSPAQLTEFTIRDPYLRNWLTEKDNAQEQVIFNYDVSYVDNLTSSIAMQASQVPVPIADNPVPPTEDYGWVGSSLIYGPPTTPGTMQNLIRDFITNTGPASIGQYFGGEGWPSYFNPDGVLKIPGGANLFANSPLNGQLSSYFTFGQNNQFMLSSGGTGPIAVRPSGDPLNDPQATQLPLSVDPATRDAFASQLAAMLENNQEVDFSISPNPTLLGKVTGYNPTGSIRGFRVTNPGSGYDPNNPPTVTITGGGGSGGTAHAVVSPDGKVTSVIMDTSGKYTSEPTVSFSGNGGAAALADIGGGTATVELNPGVSLPTGVGLSYIFSRPATDYAATDLTNLWYSWAQYYVGQFTNFVPPTGVTGSIAAGTNILTLDNPVPSTLALGMTVSDPSGSGIDPAPGTTVTILGFNPENDKQIYLSQFSPKGGSGTYTFGAPQALPFTNTDGVKSILVTNQGSGYVPATISFSGGGAGAVGAVLTSNGQVTGVQITSGGVNYTTPPTVTFSGGGTNATGTAIIQNGVVIGVTITNPGSGYLSVNITGGGRQWCERHRRCFQRWLYHGCRP
ncbi:MAG TPA: hypothetical protein VH682_25210 [Gemmataceae bacterium]|jgi:hypothetical protein